MNATQFVTTTTLITQTPTPSDLQIKAQALCAKYLGGVWSTLEPYEISVNPIWLVSMKTRKYIYISI